MALASFTFRGVRFRIKSYKRNSNQEGARLTMGYLVEWTDRIAAEVALLGGTQVIGSQPSYLTRDLPHKLEWDGDPLRSRALWCKDVSTDPDGATLDPETDETGPNYTDALLTVNYGVLPYELLIDSDVRDANANPDETTLRRYVSYPEPKSKNKVLTLKGGTWVWVDNGKDVTESTYISLPDMEHTILWWQIPWKGIPWATIQNFMNRSNSVAFSDMSWNIGYVTFSDFVTPQIRLPDGQLGSNVGYVFTHHTYGANFFPDPERGGSFHEIKEKGAGTGRPYPPVDLRLLFRPIMAP